MLTKMAATSQQHKSLKQTINTVLHENNKLTQVLGQMETKTGINRSYIVLGFAAVLALYLMIGYGAQFVCNFIGFIYPAWMSMKAIESADKKDDTQWLTYWVVYSLFHLVELVTDILLYVLPFYWFLKCCFLVWCFSSVSWNGSDLIYGQFIKPFILKHQEEIDSTLDEARDVAIDALDLAQEVVRENVHRALDHVNVNEIERNADAVMNELLGRTTPRINLKNK